ASRRHVAEAAYGLHAHPDERGTLDLRRGGLRLHLGRLRRWLLRQGTALLRGFRRRGQRDRQEEDRQITTHLLRIPSDDRVKLPHALGERRRAGLQDVGGLDLVDPIVANG